jgi:hypothetical protein
MFCPNCKCEYIRGVTQCADCGVALVDQLESPDADSADDVQIVSIWQGKDQVECDQAGKALEAAGIAFAVQDSDCTFSFLATDPTMGIWVSADDQEKARKVLLDVEGRADLDELTPEEIESLALPDSQGDGQDERDDKESDLSREWDEDEAVAEVWTGGQEDFADTLAACLKEVGIASRKLPEEGHFRVVVRPQQESRAKEIVREVVEASPPE